MRYITICELSDMIRGIMPQLPHDFDVIVGVPRSGMIPASILAQYLNADLTDLDSFIQGRIFSRGISRSLIKPACNRTNRICIVDDSVHSGKSLDLVKQSLEPFKDRFSFFYFSPIVTEKGSSCVDLYCTKTEDDRIFEWNLMHNRILANSCVDIDGVLCVDPPVDDDGEIYRAYLRNAIPLFIPTAKIGALVSCRLSKYRNETMEWLEKFNISYDHLEMLDFSTREERIKWGRHGYYKGKFYKNSSYTLFIESSASQAYEIADISHKPVICIENNTLIYNPSKKEIFKSHLSKCPRTYQFVESAYRFLKATFGK